MLLKKKEINYKFFNYVKNILSKLIFLIGLFCLFLFFIIIAYYFTSGISKRYPGIELIKRIDKVILERHVGFSIFKIENA